MTPKGIIRTMRGSAPRAKKTIHSWKQAKALLDQWRRDLANVNLEFEAPPSNRFRGQVVYFTNAEVTVRRPSGAILVVDNHEIIAVSDGKKRLSRSNVCGQARRPVG